MRRADFNKIVHYGCFMHSSFAILFSEIRIVCTNWSKLLDEKIESLSFSYTV